MPGKLFIDITISTQGLLPNIPEQFFKEMADRNYIYWGPSPHIKNKYLDQWFMKPMIKPDADHSFSIHFINGVDPYAI